MTIHRWLVTALFLVPGLFLSACHNASDAEYTSIESALSLQSGAGVADIGTGEGSYLPFYSSLVGKGGVVYGTEIDSNLLATLKDLVDRESLENVQIVQATAITTGLRKNCCDAVVLRHVYHHLTDPESTLLDLHRALKPGGRLLVIDFQPSWALAPWTPDELPEDRSGHGITPAIIAAEAEAAGFELQAEHTDWPGGHILIEHFAIVLRKEG